VEAPNKPSQDEPMAEPDDAPLIPKLPAGTPVFGGADADPTLQSALDVVADTLARKGKAA
jgi:hypothetical protein